MKKELKHNDIYINHYEGSVTSGHLIPIIAIFSGFDYKEMPKESFIVTDDL